MGLTLQDIIDQSNELYPTSRSDTHQAHSIYRIHQRLFTKLGRDTNQYTVYEDFTVADQENYQFPQGCQVYSIVNMAIQVETADGSGVYEDYKYKSLDEDSSYENYFTTGNLDSEYLLYENGEAITVDDRSIIINYYKNNVAFDGSNLAVIPSLNENYHYYLVYALVAENCSSGEDPDVELANYYKTIDEEMFKEIRYRIDENFNTASPLSSHATENM